MSGHETTRRDLLKAVGAAGVSVSLLAGCHKEDPYDLRKPVVPGSSGWARGEERHIATACGQCDSGCGIKVRVVEGRAVKVEGSPECPINHGGVGPRGQAATQMLYDPDRITGPMRRVGPRGSQEWEPIEWEQAMEMLTERLGGLREKAQPHMLGILNGRERGFVSELWSRFAEAYGTPNLFDANATNNGAQLSAMGFTQGLRELPVYDWDNAKLVLSLGSGILDTHCQLLHFVRSLGHGKRKQRRTQVVHVDSGSPRAARVADESLQTAFGTHGALALGLAHILVRDGLHDAKFVEEHTSGFDGWKDEQGREHMGYSTLLEQYSPELVASICQIPIKKLERLASLLVEHRPSFVVVGQDEMRTSNGVQTAMAVHALNALLGAIDRPGGLLVPHAPPLASWPEVEPDEIAEAGLEQPGILPADDRSPLDVLPEYLLDGSRGSLDTLFIYYANPVYSRPDASRWKKALADIPFIVSFSPTFDETNSEFADLILPDASWMERWEDSGAAPSTGPAVFTFRQPVVDPLYSTRDTANVLIDLAKELGDEVGDAMPWKNFKSAFKKRIIGLYKAKSGSIVEKKGSVFLKRFFKEGFWAGEDYEFEDWGRVLATESGRFEFFSKELWSSLEAKAAQDGLSMDELAKQWIGVAKPDLLCLPAYHAPVLVGDITRYDLLLHPYKGGNHAQQSGTSLPWLGELTPWHGRPIWSTEIEIHPTAAQPLGIRTGDKVRVRSEVGSIVGLARLTPGIRPETVRIPQGGGHTAGGRYTTGWGANVMELISMKTLDPWGGSSPLLGTRIAIEKVTS